MSGAPLAGDDRDRILAAASASSLVLIGGQAIEAWARSLGVPAVQATGDVDFQGSADDARELAAGLQYPLHLFQPKDLTTLVGVLKFTDAEGLPRDIDVLSAPYGLTGDDVQKHALTLQADDGLALRVMHPADCVISKLANLSLPNKQRPEDRAQADIALASAERYFDWVFDGDFTPNEMRSHRHHAQRLYAFATGPQGHHAFARHGLDGFAVIRPRAPNDRDFEQRLYPRLRGELDSLQSSLSPRYHAVAQLVRDRGAGEGGLRPLRPSDRGGDFHVAELVGGSHHLVVLRGSAARGVVASASNRRTFKDLELGASVELGAGGAVRPTAERGRSRG